MSIASVRKVYAVNSLDNAIKMCILTSFLNFLY